MEPIRVPAPPKEAFNKQRPLSDLLKAQVRHLQHVEAKLPDHLHSNITSRELATEEGAARYIAHLTSVLCAGAGAAQPPTAAPGPVLVPSRPTQPKRPAQPKRAAQPAAGITIAAGAEPPAPRKPRKSRAAHPAGLPFPSVIRIQFAGT